MSLISEVVSTVATFQEAGNTTLALGPDSVILPGINFLTLVGSCTPTALDINFVLHDENGDSLNLQNYIITSITVSSNPPVVVTETTPTDILFDVVGLDSATLTAYKVYWTFAASINAADINSKRFASVGYNPSGAGPSYIDNFSYPVPAIRAKDGPGTIDSGTVYVSFYCAALL